MISLSYTLSRYNAILIFVTRIHLRVCFGKLDGSCAVYTATSMMTAVLWDVAPCGLANTDDVSEELTFCNITLITETISSTETLVSICQTIPCATSQKTANVFIQNVPKVLNK
jgi:hypothetical protein